MNKNITDLENYVTKYMDGDQNLIIDFTNMEVSDIEKFKEIADTILEQKREDFNKIYDGLLIGENISNKADDINKNEFVKQLEEIEKRINEELLKQKKLQILIDTQTTKNNKKKEKVEGIKSKRKIIVRIKFNKINIKYNLENNILKFIFNGTEKSYDYFDLIFKESPNNKEFYYQFKNELLNLTTVEPVIVICYGASNSGKTYTLLGGENGSEPGLIINYVDELLAFKEEGIYDINFSITEIYINGLKDLISKSNEYKKYSEYSCKSKEIKEINKFKADLFYYLSKRQVNNNLINEKSSRSHIIIPIIYKKKENDKIIEKCTVFVDLAGNEKMKKEKKEDKNKNKDDEETKFINKSLFSIKEDIKKDIIENYTKATTPTDLSKFLSEFNKKGIKKWILLLNISLKDNLELEKSKITLDFFEK